MKAYWCTKPRNFGDALTPHVLRHFGIPVRYAELGDADAICIGSIARMASAGMMVLGSGIIREAEVVNPRADWRFVRGPHTRDRVIACGGKCPKIYGDPALLLPMFCAESRKQYDVGIVPHYADYNYVCRNYPDHHIINVVNSDPLVVAREITKCRKIISNSLHGIIAAHAYHIPAALVSFSGLWRGDIKFVDYCDAVGAKPLLSAVSRPVFTDAEDLNLTGIIDVLKGIGSEFDLPVLGR